MREKTWLTKRGLLHWMRMSWGNREIEEPIVSWSIEVSLSFCNLVSGEEEWNCKHHLDRPLLFILFFSRHLLILSLLFHFPFVIPDLTTFFDTKNYPLKSFVILLLWKQDFFLFSFLAKFDPFFEQLLFCSSSVSCFKKSSLHFMAESKFE